MATFDQKALDSSYGRRPLPFQTREDVNKRLGSPHSPLAAPSNEGKERMASPHTNYDKTNGALFSSSNKENVRSWLDSTSPTSVLNSSGIQQDSDDHPPTPSPICSPAASTPFSSRYTSMEQGSQEQARAPPTADTHTQAADEHSTVRAQSPREEHNEVLPPASRRHGKDIVNEQPPDSPTGSTFSSGSEGGLLALLASKLLAYKENGRRFSRYSRESSGPIDEKHVMEDRSKKPPVDEITATTHATLYPQSQDSEMNSSSRNGSLYRTRSEAVSELSLGSANDRTLSMEFDAMLAAAVATGIRQAAVLEEEQPRSQQLPGIQEDSSLRFDSSGTDEHDDASAQALVRVGDGQHASGDDEAGRVTRALTVMRQGHSSEEIDFNGTLSEPVSSRSSGSNGNRRGGEQNNMQIVPMTPGMGAGSNEASDLFTQVNRVSSAGSASSSRNGDNTLALVLATHTSEHCEPILSSSSSSSTSKEKQMMSIVPIPQSKPLEKVRRDRILAQAAAYQDAKSSKCYNRYKREESKITAWENQQRIKASLRMKKVEMKLEQKRAKALEKMENEIASAHKRAEERKASAEAVRAMRTARVVQEADTIRRTGRVPSVAVHVGCFPF